MKNTFLICCSLFLFQQLFAQNNSAYFKVPLIPNAEMPTWAAEMYAADPNVYKVDSLYQLHFQTNSFSKSVHSQNYRHWRRQVAQKLDQNGYIRPISSAEEDRNNRARFILWQQNQQNRNTFSSWSCLGPFETYSISTGNTRSTQVNVYTVAQANSNGDILFAGTESGGVFKSIDRGLNWSYVSAGMAVNTVTAIEIDPINADIVYFSSNNRIFKTTDGGQNWLEIYNAGGDIYEFRIDPTNTQKIFAVGDPGLIKSTNAGTNWSTQFTADCWDIDFKPGSTDTLYLLKNNPTLKIDELFRSDDGGTTWNIKNNGYYTPAVLAQASSIGGKIALSPAAPEMVYVALIGESKTGDQGWIGLYRSDNAGDNWSNPSGFIGGPYTTANPYMIGYSDGYHQGFYNFDLEVSDINPAKIWVGAIFLWTSADSGRTFQQIDPHPHADHQDIDVNGNEIWIATDGGLELSTNELASFQSRKRGIHGSDYWRLGSGWNEDILVGGRYHNGDAALFMPNYGLGQSLFLGAAEQGTGYVNPLNNRHTYFSDLGSSPLLPVNLTDAVNYLPALGLYPNEGYTLRRSELVFDCRYSEIMYLGKNNQFWKSTDGGVNFNALHSFGSNATTMEIEQSRSNPNVIYVSVFNNANSNSTKGEIHKTIDGGLNWTKLPDLPATYRREIQLAVNPANANELWVGNTYGNSGQKVYRTIDGGASWQNMSTANINGEEIRDLIYQPAPTNDIIYAATYYGVFYWNAALSDWTNMSNGLPFIINTNEMQPFFRDAKLRLGSFGRGIWEAELAAEVRPIAQALTKSDTIYCARDTVKFDCYSIVEHSGSSWSWSISPAPQYMSSTSVRNPTVVFGAAGSYSVTLNITDGNGRTSSKTIANMVTVIPACSPDTIPGLALQCNDSDDFAQTASFELTTNILTITAWVKPNGIQNDYTGIVINDGTNAAGINFRGGNNTLGYHWPGGQWWWNSNLIVPADEWSHVAMVANGNSMTLYVNGKAASQSINLSPAELSSFKIGSYRAWSDRNFNGQIDEVCIWDRALTEYDIRILRHLTKEDPNVIGNIMAYYQFNENLNSTITDNAGISHAQLANGATLSRSTAPVGGGRSQGSFVSVSGRQNLNFVGMDIQFGTGGHPNGEIVVTQINLAPDTMPAANFTGYNNYWIINNYGTNQNPVIDSIWLYPYRNTIPTAVQNNPALSEIYFRNSENAFKNQWSTACFGTAAANSYVQFPGTDCGIDRSGQFWMTADNAVTSINAQEINSATAVYPNPVQSGQYISINGIEGPFLFRLFDINGKLIKDLRLETATNGLLIEIPQLTEGIYLYHIESSKTMSSGRLHIRNKH